MTGFCLPASAQQDWTNLDSMSEPRYEASVSQYNEDIYVFNGLGAGNIVRSTIEKFDADTLSWTVVGTTSAANSTAVTHNGLIRDGNTVWLIGGRIGNSQGVVSDAVWQYNLDTGEFSAGPALPVPVKLNLRQAPVLPQLA